MAKGKSTRRSKGPKRDVNAEITNKVIEAFEAGTAPWVKPWDDKSGASIERPKKALTEVPYRGVNILLLIIAQFSRGFSVSRWMTFNQVVDLSNRMIAKDLGRKVMANAPEVGIRRKDRAIYRAWLRQQCEESGIDMDTYPHMIKGATSEYVTFCTKYTRDKKDAAGNVVRDPSTGKPKKEDAFVRKMHPVFNVEEIANLPEEIATGSDKVDLEPLQFNAELHDRLTKAFPDLPLKVGGTTACYIPSIDELRMPDFDRFKDEGAWYATELHEFVHGTGHTSRLDRDTVMRGKGGKFGPDYSREELVAELGSAFLCNHLGLDGFLQHPEYIKMYAKNLKESKYEIFRAATKAQQATDFILDRMGMLDKPETQSDDEALA